MNELIVRCKYCGSRKHRDSHCNIYLKAELLKRGSNEFDLIINAISIEDTVEQVVEIAEDKVKI